jgi:transcriptional regulator with XRE-family HTH domain
MQAVAKATCNFELLIIIVFHILSIITIVIDLLLTYYHISVIMSITKVFMFCFVCGIIVVEVIPVEFGEILYSLRKKHHLSQKQLADDLNVAQASINYWEKGERTPSIDAAKKIADYFGVSMNEMFDGIIEQSKVQLKKTIDFLDYLDSLGYKVGEGEHSDYLIHIIATDTHIELSSEDIERLEHSAKEIIELQIIKLIYSKEHC